MTTDAEKATLIISLTITSLCYVGLVTTSAMLFVKTKLRGFVFIAAGFGVWIIEQLVFFLASTTFLRLFSKICG